MPKSRTWVWLQLLGAWVPVWTLFSALMFVMHQPLPLERAAARGLRIIIPAALLGLLVHRLARRVPWPRPFRASFVLVHLVAAPIYAVAWIVGSSVVESAWIGHLALVVGPGFTSFLVLGVWFYAMIAGVSYAIDATERAAHAEAAAARTQLATLRAQLHPHFLFNALHAVVQLIPTDPARAADAAEQVASLLRTTVEEDRDVVTLEVEWAFVSRYLDLERLRFGDRLRVHAEIDDGVRGASLPSFALQTLVENAVRHGAAPNVEPTDITITATGTPAVLTLCVHDSGAGVRAVGRASRGTGLARLRERLAVLYGNASRLVVDAPAAGGFQATLVIPRLADEDA
ncbi:MAG: histidine kinase [Gemmatirosa sp.]|nr:histidine kinase [Gemmatirosa sp.]